MEIYKITNTVTDKVYIGKTKDSVKRLKKHFTNARLEDHQTKLYRSIRKHGREVFIIHIIESNISEGKIDEKEIEYIAKYDSFANGYNMTLGGEGGDTSSSPRYKEGIRKFHANRNPEDYATFGMLDKTHDEKTKQKQSQARANWHASLTNEQRESRKEKVSGKRNGMYGKTPSNAIPVLVDGKEYSSINKAAKAHNLSPYFLKKQHDVQQLNVQKP